MCFDAVMGFARRDKLLREIRRGLRKGGRLLLTDPLVVDGLVSVDEINRRTLVPWTRLSSVGPTSGGFCRKRGSG
jgi:hypothetical protein